MQLGKTCKAPAHVMVAGQRRRRHDDQRYEDRLMRVIEHIHAHPDDDLSPRCAGRCGGAQPVPFPPGVPRDDRARRWRRWSGGSGWIMPRWRCATATGRSPRSRPTVGYADVDLLHPGLRRDPRPAARGLPRRRAIPPRARDAEEQESER